MNPPIVEPTTAQSGPTPPPPSEFDAGLDALEGTDNPSLTQQPETIPERAPAPAPTTTPDPAPTPAPAPAAEATDPNPLGDDLKRFVKPAEALKPTDLSTPKALREDHAKLKGEVEAKARRIAELERAIEETKTTATESTKAAMEGRLKELETQYNQAQEKLRSADYRLSDDYKEKYVKPEEDAWKAAANALAGVKIELPDGTEREIADQDVINLAKLDERQAFDASLKMGQYGALVLQHAMRIRELSRRRHEAVSEHAKQAAEMQKARSEGLASARTSWEKGVADVLGKSSDMIGIKADDAEMTELLTSGDKLARAAMLGEVPDGADREQRIFQAQTMAGVRIKAFGAVFLRAQRAEAQLAELREKLAKYEGAEPPIGGGTLNVVDGAGPKQYAHPEDSIDDLPGSDFPG